MLDLIENDSKLKNIRSELYWKDRGLFEPSSKRNTRQSHNHCDEIYVSVADQVAQTAQKSLHKYMNF